VALVHGPVLMDTLNDVYTGNCRILAIVWEGATTAGNRVELRDPITNLLFWAGRAVDVHTYAGVNLGPSGIHAPNGFQATTLAAGQVLVYLREEL
jgi:hypothetical protein